ncbi:hypothetical protein BGW80DRAFT_1457906 [Lactifluus volemus]|nr:hypothetical protein BGW80DRAFT_1457906 [Lactifluus volemus]
MFSNYGLSAPAATTWGLHVYKDRLDSRGYHSFSIQLSNLQNTMRLASYIPYFFLLSALGVSAAPALGGSNDLVLRTDEHEGRATGGGGSTGTDWKRAMGNDGPLH